jgi:hypothetical protein
MLLATAAITGTAAIAAIAAITATALIAAIAGDPFT